MHNNMYVIMHMLIIFVYICCTKYHSQATWFRYPRYRYWRKNLATLKGTDCIGVDLNRNFDVDWNQVYTFLLSTKLMHMLWTIINK